MDKALEALERIASKQIRVDHGSVIKHVTLEQTDPEAIATIRSALSGGLASVSVDDLAEIIREVDGSHSLGAGALAEAILSKPPSPPETDHD